jgi:hypothetical protein
MDKPALYLTLGCVILAVGPSASFRSTKVVFRFDLSSFVEWQVDFEEFYSFVDCSVKHNLSIGKPLVVDEVVRESFQQVINESKRERELLAHAFVLSTHEMPEKDR